MDWIHDLQKALNYIEENLADDIDAEKISQHIYSSKDHFQKIFRIITGVPLSEYIRNRRLSNAAWELFSTNQKIIDIALKYRYETPESFTKAFSRLYGFSPTDMRKKHYTPKTFYPFTIQVVLKGGFDMAKILDVRSVGWIQNLHDERSPESFTFPACMTSLMEQIGKDVAWKTFSEHGQKWKKRRLYDNLLAATGMSFGLLWHKDNSPSCTDLTNVNCHNETIARAFHYVGYQWEIVERTDANKDEMKQLIINSIDAGRPVLVFGLFGPPECAIICGYDLEGETLLGWSHFQSYNPDDCFNNGMFQVSGWHENIWKIVLCKEEGRPQNDLKEIIRHGCSIMEAKYISGYYAGFAAYDEWLRYINHPAYETLPDSALSEIYILHHAMVGNHAEARWSLSSFLREQTDGGKYLEAAAECFSSIHRTCWEVWQAAGGLENKDAFQSFKNTEKKKEMTKLIKTMKDLDYMAWENLKQWLGLQV